MAWFSNKQEEGVTISDSMLWAAMVVIAKKAGLSPKELLREMHEVKESPDFLAEMAKESIDLQRERMAELKKMKEKLKDPNNLESVEEE